MVFLLSLNHGYIHVNNIVETPYCGKYKTQKSADYVKMWTCRSCCNLSLWL